MASNDIRPSLGRAIPETNYPEMRIEIMTSISNDPLVAQLEEDFHYYVNKVTATKAILKSSAAIRCAKLETDSECVAESNVIVNAWLKEIYEIADSDADLLPALFKVMQAKLMIETKLQRDETLLSSKFEKTDTSTLKTMAQGIRALFAYVSKFGKTDLTTTLLPIKNGKNGLLISLPSIGKAKSTKSASHRADWSVHSLGKNSPALYVGYSLVGMREILNASSVSELVEAMGHKDRNFPDSLTFTFGNSTVTRTHVPSDSPIESDDDSDENDDDEEEMI